MKELNKQEVEFINGGLGQSIHIWLIPTAPLPPGNPNPLPSPVTPGIPGGGGGGGVWPSPGGGFPGGGWPGGGWGGGGWGGGGWGGGGWGGMCGR